MNTLHGRCALLCAITLLLSACNTTGTPGTPGTPASPPLAVAPMCSLSKTASTVAPEWAGTSVSARIDNAVLHGFTPGRQAANPRGNPALGFTPDMYAFREAWLRNPFAPAVFRGQSHPLKRERHDDFKASAWTIHVQDARGAWSAIGAGTANAGDEEDDPDTAARMAPQLMPVGMAEPHMFACVGTRTDNDAVRTTMLVEALPATSQRAARVDRIQDLVYGDDHFLPNAPGILIGPARPPSPRVPAIGPRGPDGHLQCAMTQAGDDVATRELHMIGIDGGRLYHAMANRYGTATFDGGSTTERFAGVSQWGDVANALGTDFGEIVDAVVIASRPTAISVLFVARKDGGYKLWHAARYASGAWRPADDVLALGDNRPRGLPNPFRVAAGMCPLFGPENDGSGSADDELIYALYAPRDMLVMGRMVSTPRAWSPGLFGSYSPLTDIGRVFPGSSDEAQRQYAVRDVAIATRPFRDDAVAP